MSKTGLNRSPGSSTRKAYHPNPPANRSEWVMWAGNVPSDATYDELWQFFNHSVSPVASSPSADSAIPDFNSSVPPPFLSSAQISLADSSPSPSGVQSIFLISRSQCAFVNYMSEQHLHAAILRFNGRPLRPHDVRCPRLVCRVRAREDDLKAGVGGQRGAGVHTKWIKEQRAKAKATRAAGSPDASSVSERDGLASNVSSPVGTASSMMRSLSLSSAEDPGVASRGVGEGDASARGMLLRRMKKASAHSNSSESYASTNSSMLAQHFPKRYFILKSLTEFDLNLSVDKGVWATQKHNEGILDQAYRTSKDVYLIFSVNKSGEFYGYAKMAGPILKPHGEQEGDRRVSWASRPSTDSPPTRHSTTGGPSSPATSRRPVQYFSPSDRLRYEESPLPMDESKEAALASKSKLDLHSISAPAVMRDQHNPLSAMSSGPRYGERSYDPILPAASSMLQNSQASSEEFRLDPKAPDRAMKRHSADDVEEDPTGIKRWDAVPRMSGRLSLGSVKEEEDEEHLGEREFKTDRGGEDNGQNNDRDGEETNAAAQKQEDRQNWGESFRIEWIKTTRLPFYRTRQFRNPWNHDREVKVSRDGTELEPSVGQALLNEWDKPEPPPPS
ncbi:YT521-B-like domain-containing protein [Irpex rosettiformis]|uniref:YT521-B-like domain-containing protein n=1 Tax=Irpex rosettiformis TaxID=378272 RepID=A0ACB8U0Q7_9APHY|nr:YT521-B-like domain-containing protein [Irpex rosettiformis]